jgi:hypothetical protein
MSWQERSNHCTMLFIQRHHQLIRTGRFSRSQARIWAWAARRVGDKFFRSEGAIPLVARHGTQLRYMPDGKANEGKGYAARISHRLDDLWRQHSSPTAHLQD